MSTLASKKCLPVQKGTPALKGKELAGLSKKLGAAWKVVKKHQLEREYKFPDFAKALAFTNKVGKLAEKQNHHPDIFLAWGKVKLTLWTHTVGGLSESDFVFAAKVSQIKSQGLF